MNFKNTLFEPLFNRGKILLKQEISEIIAEHEKRFKSKKRKDFLKYLSRHNYIRRVLVSLYYVNSFDERNMANIAAGQIVLPMLCPRFTQISRMQTWRFAAN